MKFIILLLILVSMSCAQARYESYYDTTFNDFDDVASISLNDYGYVNRIDSAEYRDPNYIQFGKIYVSLINNEVMEMLSMDSIAVRNDQTGKTVMIYPYDTDSDEDWIVYDDSDKFYLLIDIFKTSITSTVVYYNSGNMRLTMKFLMTNFTNVYNRIMRN